MEDFEYKYLDLLKSIKKRPGMYLLPNQRVVETLYAIDLTWGTARPEDPNPKFIDNLSKLKKTGNVIPTSKDISFEEGLDLLIKLVEESYMKKAIG